MTRKPYIGDMVVSAVNGRVGKVRGTFHSGDGTRMLWVRFEGSDRSSAVRASQVRILSASELDQAWFDANIPPMGEFSEQEADAEYQARLDQQREDIADAMSQQWEAR